MNKTKNIARSSIASCIKSHCQGEQSAASVQICESVGEKQRTKTSLAKSLWRACSGFQQGRKERKPGAFVMNF